VRSCLYISARSRLLTDLCELRRAGTFILGLSWLIGTTAQEILASIIFLFIKHPYDVGDRVCIDTVDYTVLEMHLLSTVFKRIDGTVTQAPHSQLNLKFILK
jgi:small-conductance mechanosensitive channel